MSGHFERPVVSGDLLYSAAVCSPGEESKETCNVSLRAAAMTLRTVLLSLQALLAAAEPDDPQDAVVANQVIHKAVLAWMGFYPISRNHACRLGCLFPS